MSRFLFHPAVVGEVAFAGGEVVEHVLEIDDAADGEPEGRYAADYRRHDDQRYQIVGAPSLRLPRRYFVQYQHDHEADNEAVDESVGEAENLFPAIADVAKKFMNIGSIFFAVFFIGSLIS